MTDRLKHSIHIYEDEIETLESILHDDQWHIHGHHAWDHVTAWRDRIELLKNRLARTSEEERPKDEVRPKPPVEFAFTEKEMREALQANGWTTLWSDDNWVPADRSWPDYAGTTTVRAFGALLAEMNLISRWDLGRKFDPKVTVAPVNTETPLPKARRGVKPGSRLAALIAGMKRGDEYEENEDDAG